MDISSTFKNSRLGASSEGMESSGAAAKRFEWSTLWVAHEATARRLGDRDAATPPARA